MATGDERSKPAPTPPEPPRKKDEDVLAWHLRRISEDDRRDGAAPWDSAI